MGARCVRCGRPQGDPVHLKDHFYLPAFTIRPDGSRVATDKEA